MKRLITSLFLIVLISFSGVAYTPQQSTSVEVLEKDSNHREIRKHRYKRKAFENMKKVKKIKKKQFKRVKKTIKAEITS